MGKGDRGEGWDAAHASTGRVNSMGFRRLNRFFCPPQGCESAFAKHPLGQRGL